jgi:hypothetical protein
MPSRKFPSGTDMIDAFPIDHDASDELALVGKSRARRIYLAGPMRGIPHFNFPAFYKAAEHLRRLGFEVFNPADRDNEHHGTDISAGNIDGCEDRAAREHGFSLREALGADLAWICAYADAVALLPGWENSAGARAERATGKALGLEIIALPRDFLERGELDTIAG